MAHRTSSGEQVDYFIIYALPRDRGAITSNVRLASKLWIDSVAMLFNDADTACPTSTALSTMNTLTSKVVQTYVTKKVVHEFGVEDPYYKHVSG
jgi:hypothetical protein